MSTLTQFLPQTGIKSVQRGVITITAGNYNNTATISSVNTGKSYLNWLGSITGSSIDPYSIGMSRIELTSSTTVEALRGVNTGGCSVSYEVVEFY